MALRTFVKVSGINNLSDARYCAGMEVNELGFNIEPNHENFTDPQKFKEMTDWLSGVEFVGEINSAETNLAETASEYELDALLINHINQIDDALATGLKVSYHASSATEAQSAWERSNQKLDYLVISNQEHNDDDLKSMTFPLVLIDGFNAENLTECLQSISPKGIALKGGDEIRPGYKDFDELADILELLEIDDMAQ